MQLAGKNPEIAAKNTRKRKQKYMQFAGKTPENAGKKNLQLQVNYIAFGKCSDL